MHACEKMCMTVCVCVLRKNETLRQIFTFSVSSHSQARFADDCKFCRVNMQCPLNWGGLCLWARAVWPDQIQLKIELILEKYIYIYIILCGEEKRERERKHYPKHRYSLNNYISIYIYIFIYSLFQWHLC